MAAQAITTNNSKATNKDNLSSECGYWEDYHVLCVLRNERDEILGIMVNCGAMKGVLYDVWVGWDYTVLSSEGKPNRIGMNTFARVRELVEGLMKV